MHIKLTCVGNVTQWGLNNLDGCDDTTTINSVRWFGIVARASDM